MRVTVYYQNGKIDEFDTSTFTKSDPFEREGVNLLTEFQLRLDLLKTEGLLLDVFWYNMEMNEQTPSSYDEEIGMKMPHAVRSLGRRIRLVSPDEINELVQITRDGELLVWRQGNELIDAVKFSNQEILCFSSANTESINRKATVIFEYLKKANPTWSDEETAQAMGYTLEAYRCIQAWETENIDYDSDVEAMAAELLESIHESDEPSTELSDEISDFSGDDRGFQFDCNEKVL